MGRQEAFNLHRSATNFRLSDSRNVFRRREQNPPAGGSSPMLARPDDPARPSPVQLQALLGGAMPRVVVRMQVLTGRRDRCVTQVVPHVSQINLAIHHV
jgi:hypothetical protein